MAVLSMTTISLYLLSSILLLLHLVSAARDGFSMKLIHRDSEESPFYPGNLTFEERAKRFHHQSMARLNQVASTIRTATAVKGANETDSVHPNMIGPSVAFDGMFYLARVGIGTFTNGPAYRSYFFMVDTGSHYPWLQYGHNPCYGPQFEPISPYHESSSFGHMRCADHPSSCNGGGISSYCRDTYCYYHLQYFAGSCGGMVCRETFTFTDNNNRVIGTFPDLIFGCGSAPPAFPFNPPTKVAGILGFGHGSPSFLNQIASRYDYRFSYCLQLQGNTFLRFGIDAQFQASKWMRSTIQLLTISGRGAETTAQYYLPLVDISIAGYRMYLAPGTFSRGCLLDTGSPFTLIVRNVYDLIRQRLVNYFQQLNVPVIQIYGYDLCFKRPYDREIPYPTMVYHFQVDANLRILKTELFEITPYVFCPTIIPHDSSTMSVLIGSLHQVNHRFMFNTRFHELSFAREQCI